MGDMAGPVPQAVLSLRHRLAAKLDKLEDGFVTCSGRRVRLAIYVDPGKLDQCGFAMEALKRADEVGRGRLWGSKSTSNFTHRRGRG